MSSPRPNILWICTDQQRFDTLGCAGNSFVQTPHIDRLAQQGVRFEHAYCQSPICTPSRASFLTGRYPRTTRCRANGQMMPADERLVTKLLHDAGYTCGLSGKLHIAPCHPSVNHGTEPRIDDGYDEFHWSHHPQPDWPTNAYHHWLHERGVVYKTEPFRGSAHVKAGMPAAHHQTTWCAQMAINFMEAQAGRAQPWLFSVNIFDPHHAFDPPVAYLERYLAKLDTIPLPQYVPGELADKPQYQQMDHAGAYNNANLHPFAAMTAEEHRLVTAAYWAMIDLIDVQVGRMMAALERTGQLENTLVIFMSDHGEMLGDHGIYLKGPYFYEPLIRVPLIVCGPGISQRGQTSNALVELMDIAPTLLDAAQQPPQPGIQGRSLWPLLTGQASLAHHHDDVYCEYYNAMPWHREPTAQATMIRTDTHKMVAVHSLNTGELYDLRADPTETRNLWNDPTYQEVKTEMLLRLCNRMAWTVDPLPTRQSQW
ncbi:MAG: sulfatase-like hydrolase/transferase [Caldilineaceae bacterium]|nr:sulfatase-like hydrolase/transferase [Caldilineaceae bacterium]